MMKASRAISLVSKSLLLVLFVLLSSCGGGGADSVPLGEVKPIPMVPGVLTPVAPGRLLSVNTTSIQTAMGIMTMATNPQNSDVYIGTMSTGDSPFDAYSTIRVMRPDNATGLLTQVWMVYHVQGLQWLTQILVDPAGKYVYFYGRTHGGAGNAISIYEVGSDGMLFYKNTVPVSAGNVFNCCVNTLTGVTLSPDGRYIYGYYPVLLSSNGNPEPQLSEFITVYGVDQDAKITALDSVELPNVFNLVQSPSVLHTVVASNHFVYIQHMDGSGISTYSNNNGKLTLVSDGVNVNTHHRALAMALDPSGQFLYAAASVNDQIKIYVHSIAVNGSLEIVNIIDGIEGGGTPFDMMIDSSNRYLYLFQSGGIGMYRIEIPGEILVPLGMQSAYTNSAVGVESPGFFAMNTSGKYMYTLGLSDKPTLTTFIITQPISGG